MPLKQFEFHALTFRHQAIAKAGLIKELEMNRTSKIGEWSLGYKLYALATKLPFNYYYKKIEVVNREKIKIKAPVILAPNHQGALMDALTIIFGLRTEILFLARADIFKKPLIIKFLHFIKILPAYRSRDGRESLQKNDEIFDLTVEVLHKEEVQVCLFPEGNHGNKRRLRPLVKGIFRIAFQAQEKYDSQPAVKLIPIGIDYGHYQKFRSTQLIIVGDPIEVSDYWQEYTENQAVAMNSLRDRLSDEMRKIMIDIETEDYYDLYMGLRKLYNKRMCERLALKTNMLFNKFLADKRMIATLNGCLQENPSEIDELNKKYTEYNTLMNKLNFREWVSEKQGYSILWNIMALIGSIPMIPIFLLGLFNNWPHFFIPPYKFRKLKDPQFLSTAKWGMAYVIFPLYFIPLVVLAIVFLPFWWLKILYIITFIRSGIVALGYRNFIVKALARIRYTIQIRRKDIETVRLNKLHKEIINSVDRIIDTYSRG